MTTVFVWLACFASYLILAGQFSLDELAAAALLGVVGAAWHRAILGTQARRFAFEPRAALVIGQALWGLPLATVNVGRQLVTGLLRPAEGQRIARVFAHGRQNSPRDAGRRAVVVLATSLAPDAYVLRVPLDEDTIMTHALTDTAPGNDPRWPA